VLPDDVSPVDHLKARANAVIDSLHDRLVGISTTLHANPEVAFQEFKSAALLCDTLEQAGFQVMRGVGGLETAFRAEARGKGDGPTVALLAEYDALPELGHACGHNIMGTAAIGAAVAVKSVLAEMPGRVVVVGTPAEEGGGGKVILVDKGIFNDVDAAMIVHPSGRNMVARGSLASTRLFLEFRGRASHAAAAPEEGINALEGVILTFNNVNALRLHLRPDARVHGIITHGGTAANIIPDFAAAQFSVRAAKQGYAQLVLRRVIQCAEAGAAATGSTLKHWTRPSYAELIPNLTLAQAFADNWESIGVRVNEVRLHERMGSTDMGNVSQVVPAIHPYVKIVGEGVGGHTIQFREASVSPMGHAGLIYASKGMAMTTIDLLTDPELLLRIKNEFYETVRKQQEERLGKFE
jgi:amidohydrolase